ncbi:MAG: hypothetical protein ABMA00_06180 [Gemmatimonas sp.]
MEAFVSASALGDTFPAYSFALSNISTDEVAIRHHDDGSLAVQWTVLDSALRVSQVFSLPRSFRVLSFSEQYLLLARRDTDDEASPARIYWFSRARMRPTP